MLNIITILVIKLWDTVVNNFVTLKSGMDRRGTLHRGTMLRHSRVNHDQVFGICL